MSGMRRWLVPLFAVALGCGLIGCGGETGEQVPTPDTTVKKATAIIEAVGESELSGSATFVRTDDVHIMLALSLENLSPGSHAVHIHETGDCGDDGNAAGGHWNPYGGDHGKWDVAPFHLGDIGNVEVGEDGTGSLTLTTDLWTIGTGQDDDLLNRAIIVHEGPDDFTTQPTGNAGGRIGCGVIEPNQ